MRSTGYHRISERPDESCLREVRTYVFQIPSGNVNLWKVWSKIQRCEMYVKTCSEFPRTKSWFGRLFMRGAHTHRYYSQFTIVVRSVSLCSPPIRVSGINLLFGEIISSKLWTMIQLSLHRRWFAGLLKSPSIVRTEIGDYSDYSDLSFTLASEKQSEFQKHQTTIWAFLLQVKTVCWQTVKTTMKGKLCNHARYS